jgi:organic radical activating enzyme
MNHQRPERILRHAADAVDVVNIFRTIQGEGPHAGRPAIFIRLAGCNLQCPLCDTDYTSGRVHVPTEHLVERVRALSCESSPQMSLVVITGGEPFRQPINELVRKLLFWRFRVQVETNGAVYRDELPFGEERFDIVCSPKTGVVNALLLPHIDAFKYVARASDIDWKDGLPATALDHPNHGGLYRPPMEWRNPWHLSKQRFIYLQPCDEKSTEANAKNTEAVVESCLRFGHRLCLQLHKLVGLE